MNQVATFVPGARMSELVQIYCLHIHLNALERRVTIMRTNANRSYSVQNPEDSFFKHMVLMFMACLRTNISI